MRSREFLLLTFSYGLSHVFLTSLAPLLPLIRKEFSLSYTVVGVFTFVLVLCFAFAGIPAGILSDKIDRVKLLLSIFLALGILSSAIIFTSGFRSVLTLLAFLFFSVGLFRPSAYPYLSKRYSERKGKRFGLFETGGNTGKLTAPLVAGVIGSWLGWRCVYLLWGTFAFAVAFILYRFSFPNTLLDDRRNKSKEKQKRNRDSPSKHPYPCFKTVYVTSGFFGFIAGGSKTFIPLFLTDEQSVSVSVAGAMLTLFLAGGLVGGVIGGRLSDAWGPKTVLEMSFIATCLLMLLVPFTAGPLLIATLVCAGVTLYIALPALSFLIGEAKTAGLGLAFGIQSLSIGALGALSRVFLGIIGDLLGISYIFFFLSAVGFIASAFVYFYIGASSTTKEY